MQPTLFQQLVRKEIALTEDSRAEVSLSRNSADEIPRQEFPSTSAAEVPVVSLEVAANGVPASHLSEAFDLSNSDFEKSDAWAEVVRISQSLSHDFTPVAGGKFSKDDQEKLVRESAARLTVLLKKQIAETRPEVSDQSDSSTSDAVGTRAHSFSSLSASQIRSAWTGVVREYHSQKQWGFVAEKKSSALQSWSPEAKEMLPYLWVLVQSLVILKITIYYFGLLASNEPSREHDIYLTLALGFCAFSLSFFAYRMYRKETRSKDQSSASSQSPSEPKM